MPPRRIGILTGGGDVPGLNSVIKTFVGRMLEAGREVLGLRRGWAALLHVDSDDGDSVAHWVRPLDREAVRTIDRFGGTVLHSSRLNPSRVLPSQLPEGVEVAPDEKKGTATLSTIDLTPRILGAVEALELDAIVAIGGDGTLSFARRLHREGVPVVAIPKTMDNDVFGTDYSLGFSTAVSRSVQLINQLRTAAGSHERLLIVELFGRESGEPCLLASYLADADRTLIAESPFRTEHVLSLLLADKEASPSGYAVLTVSEGAHPESAGRLESGEPDAVGHRKLGGIGAWIARAWGERTGERAMHQSLGYLMRSGPPDSLDQLVARSFGQMAANLLLDGKSGSLVAVVGGRYRAVALERTGEGIRRVDVDRFYDREKLRPRLTDIVNLPMFLH